MSGSPSASRAADEFSKDHLFGVSFCGPTEFIARCAGNKTFSSTLDPKHSAFEYCSGSDDPLLEQVSKSLTTDMMKNYVGMSIEQVVQWLTRTVPSQSMANFSIPTVTNLRNCMSAFLSKVLFAEQGMATQLQYLLTLTSADNGRVMPSDIEKAISAIPHVQEAGTQHRLLNAFGALPQGKAIVALAKKHMDKRLAATNTLLKINAAKVMADQLVNTEPTSARSLALRTHKQLSAIGEVHDDDGARGS